MQGWVTIILFSVGFLPNLPAPTQSSRVNIVSFAYAGKEASQGNAAIVPTIDVAIERSKQQYPNVFSNIHWISKASPYNGSNIAPCDAAEDSAISEGVAQWLNASSVFYGRLDFSGRNQSGLTVFVTSVNCDKKVFRSGTFDEKMSDKSRYPSVLAFGALSVTQMASSLSAFMDQYHWQSIVAVSDTLSKGADLFNRYNSMCIGSLKMLEGRMQNGTMQFLRIPIDSDAAGFEWPSVLWQISNFSRIVLLCTTTRVQRTFLSAAYENNMANGDYVFISPFIGSVPKDLALKWNRNESIDQNVRKALPNVFIFRHPPVNWTKIEDVTDAIIDRRIEYYHESYETASFYRENDLSLSCLEAVEALAEVLNETYTSLPDYISGKEFARRFFNKSIEIETRKLTISPSGSRQTVLEVVQYDVNKKDFETVYVTDPVTRRLVAVKGAVIEWKGKEVPRDRPACGLHGEYCIDHTYQNMIIEAVVGAFLAIAAIAVVVVLRLNRQRREAELLSQWWRVDFADLSTLPVSTVHGATSLYASQAVFSPAYQQTTIKETLTAKNNTNSHRLAIFNERMVWTTCFVIPTEKEKQSIIVPNRTFLKFMRKLHTVQHRHINDFVGACLEKEYNFVEEYRKKGSIYDMNQSSFSKGSSGFDWDMKFSFLVDLADALRFLHSSQIKFHGNLKSTKCLLDNYFTLKLSDVGNERMWCYLSRRAQCPASVYYTLWTAPEVLRGGMPSEQSDIYTYGIIAVEIFTQSGPFNTKTLHPADLESMVEKVKKNTEEFPFRPSLESLQLIPAAESAFKTFLQGCWAENPDDRFTMRQAGTKLDTVMEQLKMRTKGSLFDRLMRRLNAHARTLEHTVAERTQELIEERNHCDMLLKEMLPKEILKQLRAGQIVHPEHFECATIYFSSIFGFLNFAISSPPMTVIQFLNGVYLEFDVSIDGLEVYKVETISDSYMVCSGLPTRTFNNIHAAHVCEMALILQSRFAVKFSQTQLQLRVGINSGPVVAGVVGLKCPRYCLFGDTINTASRMESNGVPSKNHMSEAAASLAKEYGFVIEPRGEVFIKGKGNLITYWLISKDGAVKDIPVKKLKI
ncbi:atrial natriuretic peptide receptor 1-like [Paramacrobiotus metropolitanus]|uniref:atrial natriuretic peptide receptor 1-like n=1 Tax=Paramacrobiotus metropolitanus TaxID=2943436 RepID=UPI0024464705|nr:atrial natriuretic peptide receptor 1-like [Paramacrobiotus metropolitanus]